MSGCMRWAGRLGLCLLAASCDDFEPGFSFDDQIVTDTTLRCRNGLLPASDSSVLLIDQLVLDGLTFYPAFDAGAVYEDEPAACLSSDGTAAGFNFEIDGEPAGYLYVALPEEGSFSLVDSSSGAEMTVSVDLDDVRYTAEEGDYADGAVSATSVGSSLVGDAYGLGTTGSSVVVSASFEVYAESVDAGSGDTGASATARR